MHKARTLECEEVFAAQEVLDISGEEGIGGLDDTFSAFVTALDCL